jgi:hypothetical protein
MSGPFDGWVVMHTKGEGDDREGYGIGPFPTREVAEAVAATGDCDCDLTVVAILFPQDMRIMVIPGIDAETVEAQKQDKLN